MLVTLKGSSATLTVSISQDVVPGQAPVAIAFVTAAGQIMNDPTKELLKLTRLIREADGVNAEVEVDTDVWFYRSDETANNDVDQYLAVRRYSSEDLEPGEYYYEGVYDSSSSTTLGVRRQTQYFEGRFTILPRRP